MSKNSILIVVLVGLMFLVFVASRISQPLNKTNTKPESEANQAPLVKPTLDRAIDINDVVTDPAVYSDLTLTLEGKINNWVTKNAFTFTPVKSSFASSGKTLPVINRFNFKLPEDTPESDLALGEVANIRVTGKIVIFDRATLEQEWKVDLDDKEFNRWNKSPVIIVNTIEKI